ncbi:hypothetical protein BH20ACI4_BH20ACI4_19630 [soil metagenome]
MNFKLTICIVFLFFLFVQTLSGQTTGSEQATGVELSPNEPIVANNAMSVRNFSVEGQKYGYAVLSGYFAKSPAWDALSGKEPPLSLGNALITAKTNLKRFVKDEQDWKIEKIELRPFEIYNDKQIETFWLYDVEFRSTSKEYKPFGESFFIFVKMNNEIIEPIVGREIIMGIPGIRKK